MTPAITKQMNGTVLKKSGDKTVSVEVVRQTRHPKYGKKIITSRRYLVHDEENKAVVGDNITIKECHPISRRKRWKITQ